MNTTVISRSYSDEFKLEAVKLAQETSIVEAANRLGIPQKTLANWVARFKSMNSLPAVRPRNSPNQGAWPPCKRRTTACAERTPT